MSGAANNLPVQVTLEGIEAVNQQLRDLAQGFRAPAQAAQQLPAAIDRAGEGFSRFRGVIGQAGFQIQDFVVQVQSGTSALTALSQQGSQLLGVFGTGGAVAGAALTIGLLGAQLLGVGRSAQDAGDGVNDFVRSIQAAARETQQLDQFLGRLQARFTSVIEAARQQRIRELNTDITQLQNRANEALLTAANRDVDARQAAEEQAELRRLLVASNTSVSGAGPLPERDRLAAVARIEELQRVIEGAQRDAEGLVRQARRFDFEIQRAEAILRGEISGDSNANPGTIPTTRAGASAGGARPPATRSLSISVGDVWRREDEEARRLREREEDQYLRRVEQANERTTDSIVRYAGDAFADLFSQTGGGFDAMMARFQQAARQTFARIAADAIIRPIVAPIVASLGLGGIGSSGATGGLSALTGGGWGGFLNLGGALNSAAGALGLGGLSLGGLFSTPLWGNSVAAAGMFAEAPAAALGLSGAQAASLTGLGPSLGQLFGGIGLGFGLGTFLGSFSAGNAPARQTNSMIGAGIGSGLGFLVGGPIGALIGGGLGGLGGGFIGPSPHPAYHIRVGGNAEGQLGIIDTGQKHVEEQFQQALAEAQQQIAALNAVMQHYGISVSGVTLFGSDPSADPNRPATLDAALGKLKFSATSANLSTALSNHKPISAADLAGTAEWVTTVYDVLIKAGEPADAFAEALKAINAQFDGAVEQARKLGLSEDALEQARQRSLAAAEQARQDAASATLLGPISSLSSYVTSLRTSGDSPLSPLGRREAAQAELQRAAGAAMGGDLLAYGQAQAGATAFLAASRDVYGSGVGYTQDFMEVLARLDALVGRSPADLTAQVFAQETRSQTEILAAALETLRVELAALRAEVQQGNRMPSRLQP